MLQCFFIASDGVINANSDASGMTWAMSTSLALVMKHASWLRTQPDDRTCVAVWFDEEKREEGTGVKGEL